MKHKLLVIWPQYRRNNKYFFEQLKLNQKVDLRVVWVRELRKDELPPAPFLSGLQYDIVGAEDIRVGDYKLSQFVKLIRILYKNIKNSDYVLTSTQAPVHSKLAFILCKLLKKKLFVIVEQWHERKSIPFSNRLYAEIGYFIIRHCDKVFVHGTNQQLFVKSRGVEESKVAVLPFLSDDLSKLTLTKPNLKQQLGLHDKKVILYFGRITPQKGLLDLIAAFKNIKSKIDKAALLVCGGSDRHFHDFNEAATYEKKCRKKAAELAYKDIIFTGPIHPLDKQNYFAIADIFVHPHTNLSDMSDGWSLSINEAASMSLPIITTDRVGSVADLVRNDFSGYIVKSGDVQELSHKIVEVIGSEKKLKGFSKNSRLIFEDYHNVDRLNSGILGAIYDSQG